MARLPSNVVMPLSLSWELSGGSGFFGSGFGFGFGGGTGRSPKGLRRAIFDLRRRGRLLGGEFRRRGKDRAQTPRRQRAPCEGRRPQPCSVPLLPAHQ